MKNSVVRRLDSGLKRIIDLSERYSDTDELSFIPHSHHELVEMRSSLRNPSSIEVDKWASLFKAVLERDGGFESTTKKFDSVALIRFLHEYKSKQFPVLVRH